MNSQLKGRDLRKKLGAKVFIGLLAALMVALAACTPQTPPAPATPTTPAASPAPGGKATPSSPKTAADQEWQGVLAAARKEGSLNLYTTFAPPELRAAMSKAIQDQYGIKMEWLVASGGAANAERIRVEQKAKQYVADVWWTGFSVLLTQQLRDIDALKPFTPPIVGLEPGVWRGKGIDSITDKRDALTITQRTALLLVINTKTISSNEYPKAFKDLLDPKWKGKIAMMDPAVPGGGAYTFGLLKKEYGADFWDKMKAQDITVIRDYSEVGRRVSIGEASVALGLAPSHVMAFLTAGAPIKIVVPPEGSLKTNGPMYLINNAPHTNAGKVFLNWTLTKEGQEMIARLNGDESIRTDVTYKSHPEIDNAINTMPKWLVGSWDVIAEFDTDVSGGTARKVLGLK